MDGSKNLSIVITGQLDIKATQKQINEQLRKFKLDNVNIRLNIDSEKLIKLNEGVRKQAYNYEQWWTNALDREDKKREKVLQTDVKKTQELQKQLELYRRQSQVKVQKLQTSFGTTNINSKSLLDYQNAVANLSTKTPSATYEMQKLNTSFKELESNARKSANSIGGSFNSALQKITLWGGATSIIYGLIGGLQQMLQTIVELDTQITQLKRVMDENTNFEAMLESSISLANELGQRITTINEAMIEYARTGLDPSVVEEYSRATVMAMNISELSAKEASDTIIAGMLIFKDELKDSIDLVSRLNEVDNNFAVTTQDLSNALMKAASSGKTAGVSLNELLGHVTAIQEATREGGKVIGNSLKTIYVNITQDRGAIDALNSIGISMKDAEGNLKSASTLLQELANRWSTLTEEEQRNVSLAIAKKYHINRLNALMLNYNQALNASEAALNSEGSAVRENIKYMESLQAKLNKLSAAWEELSYTVGKAGVSDTFSGIIQLTTTLIRGLSNLVEVTKEWGDLLAILGGPVTSALNAMGNMGNMMSGLFDPSSSSAESLLENAKASQANANAIDTLIKKYTELNDPTNKSITKQQELQKVLGKIQEIAPELVTKVDQYGKALEINSESAQKYAENLRNMSEEEVSLLEAQNLDDLEKISNEISQKKDEVNAMLENLKNAKQIVEDYEKKYNVSNDVQAIEEARKRLLETTKQITNAKYSGNQELVAQLEEQFRIISDARDQYIKSKNEVLKQDTTKSVEELQKLSALEKGYLTVKDAIDEFRGVKVKTSSATDDLIAKFYGLNDELDETLTNVDELNEKNTKLEEKMRDISDSISEYNSILKDASEGKAITAEKAAQLILKEKELANAFSFENGMVKVNIKAFQDMRNKKLKTFADIELARKNDLENQRDTLTKKLKGYGILIEGINTVKEAESAIENFDAKMYNAKSIAEAAAYQKAKRETEKYKDYLEQTEQINKLISLISSPDYGTSSSSGSAGKSYYSALSKDAKELIQIETELQELQSKRSTLLTSSEEYRESLKDEQRLIQKKISLLKQEYEQVTKTQYISGKIHSDKYPAKLSDDAFKKANELSQQIDKLQVNLNSLSFEQINSKMQEFGYNNQIVDAQMKILQERISSYKETSQEYRDALNQENAHLKTKQDNLHREAEFLREQLKLGNLNSVQQKDLNDKIAELQATWLSYQNSIDERKLRQLNSLLSEQKLKTDDLTKAIDLSSAKMATLMNTNTEQYLTEYANYLQLTNLKKQSLQEEINLREKLIQQNLNNLDLVRQYKNEIVDLQIEQLRLQEVINQQTADKIIDTYKQVYEQQKNAALKALKQEESAEKERHKKQLNRIDEQRKKKEKAIQKEIEAIEDAKKAEDERHKAAMSALDEELNKFNEAIDNRLKLIDRESSEREYDNELEKLQSERQKIQEQINRLSLDDSYEAKLRLSELNEELANKDKAIEDLNYKRSTELRKDNLEDQRDAYEKDIEAKKKAEEAKYNEAVKKLDLEKKKLDQQLVYYKDYYDKLVQKENEKHDKIISNLEKERERTEAHFNELIADERRYADMREAIMEGNLSNFRSQLDAFKSFIEQNMSTIGTAISTNLLAKIEESKRALEELNKTPLPNNGTGGGSDNNGGNKNNSDRENAWKTYLSNKKRATDIYEQTGKWPDDLRTANESLRKKYGFPDGTYDDLKDLKTYHDGGIVDGKSDRLTELVNKMFNLQPSEDIAKVLKGELWTTPQNISQNFVPNLKNLMSSVTPVINVSGSSSSGSGDINFKLNIERFTGTEADYKKIADFVMDNIIFANKKKGR